MTLGKQQSEQRENAMDAGSPSIDWVTRAESLVPVIAAGRAAVRIESERSLPSGVIRRRRCMRSFPRTTLPHVPSAIVGRWRSERADGHENSRNPRRRRCLDGVVPGSGPRVFALGRICRPGPRWRGRSSAGSRCGAGLGPVQWRRAEVKAVAVEGAHRAGTGLRASGCSSAVSAPCRLAGALLPG